jgi:hypothetical protein
MSLTDPLDDERFLQAFATFVTRVARLGLQLSSPEFRMLDETLACIEHLEPLLAERPEDLANMMRVRELLKCAVALRDAVLAFRAHWPGMLDQTVQ